MNPSNCIQSIQQFLSTKFIDVCTGSVTYVPNGWFQDLGSVAVIVLAVVFIATVALLGVGIVGRR